MQSSSSVEYIEQCIKGVLVSETLLWVESEKQNKSRKVRVLVLWLLANKAYDSLQ